MASTKSVPSAFRIYLNLVILCATGWIVVGCANVTDATKATAKPSESPTSPAHRERTSSLELNREPSIDLAYSNQESSLSARTQLSACLVNFSKRAIASPNALKNAYPINNQSAYTKVWQAWEFCLQDTVSQQRQKISPPRSEVPNPVGAAIIQSKHQKVLPIVQFHSIRIEPPIAAPGESVTFSVRYTVSGNTNLPDSDEKPLSWAEIGRLRLINKDHQTQQEISLPEVAVTSSAGQYETKIQLQIPEAHLGFNDDELIFLFRVVIGGKQYEQSLPFRVQPSPGSASLDHLREKPPKQTPTNASIASKATISINPKNQEKSNNAHKTSVGALKPPESLQVTVRSASIRESASLQAKIIAKAQKDEKLKVSDQKTVDGQTWYAVSFIEREKEIKGWIFSSIVKVLLPEGPLTQ